MERISFWVWATGFLIISLITCGLSLELSRHGFDGYDMSPMIDSGWRVLLGQSPGRDFLVTFPPSLYLLTALFYRTFGLTWHAMVLGTCCIFLLSIILGLRIGFLVKQTRGAVIALCTLTTYVAAQTLSIIISSVLWHSSLAMMIATYAIYIVYAWLGSADSSPWVRRELILSLTPAIAGLILSKPNTAYPAILLSIAVLALAGLSKRILVIICGVAVVLAQTALLTAHVSLIRMLTSYAGLTGRLIPKAFFEGTFYAINTRFGLANLFVYFALVPTCGTIFAYAWRTRRHLQQRHTELLAIGAIAIAILAMGTNFQFKLSDMPLAMMGITFLALEGGLASPTMRRKAIILACTMFFFAFYIGRTRLAFQVTGGWTNEDCYNVPFEDSFLGSMKGCQIIPQTLGEIDQALSQKPGANVFFGPGFEFLYARRHIAPPRSMPDWWDPGTSYPLSKAGELSAAWKDHHFDILIFGASEGREKMPSEMNRLIAKNYTLDSTARNIHVYRLASSSGAIPPL